MRLPDPQAVVSEAAQARLLLDTVLILGAWHQRMVQALPGLSATLPRSVFPEISGTVRASVLFRAAERALAALEALGVSTGPPWRIGAAAAIAAKRA